MTTSRLTAKQVQEVRALARLGFRVSSIARVHQISDSGVSDILHRRTYASIPDEPVDLPLLGPAEANLLRLKKGEPQSSSIVHQYASILGLLHNVDEAALLATWSGKADRAANHANATLTIQQVQTVRDLHCAGFRGMDIARIFNVCHAAAFNLIKGKSWRFVPDAPAPLPVLTVENASILRLRIKTWVTRHMVEEYAAMLSTHHGVSVEVFTTPWTRKREKRLPKHQGASEVALSEVPPPPRPTSLKKGTPLRTDVQPSR